MTQADISREFEGRAVFVAAHPFEQHEVAFQSLIRLKRGTGSQDAEQSDACIRSAYDAAVLAATVFCRRVKLSPPAECAMEAVHELFCQLRPHAAKGFDASRPLFPYVYAALWYIVLGTARRQRPFVPLEERVSSNEESDNPLFRAQLNELIELVERLPIKERDAVRLRFFSGLSSRDAARNLNVSRNAVDLRVHRGISRLRRRLD